MESIESIACVMFQKTFSSVVIQSENKFKFNFQGHCTLTFANECLRVSLKGMCKQ